MSIQHATDDTFEQLVLKNDKPVVVDFWATWCGPCKMVAPEMEKIAAKYEGSVDVVKVDVDANPRISQAFNIMSIPTIAFFRPGQQPMGVAGARPMEALEAHFGLAQYAADASETAATESRSTRPSPARPSARAAATYAPEIAAQRVPPSAWSTSQSSQSVRSPSASRSATERSARPISRWISTVRPFCRPVLASRCVRSPVDAGSSEYSAVSQPRPEPLSQRGVRSSSEAVQSTRVLPCA